MNYQSTETFEEGFEILISSSDLNFFDENCSWYVATAGNEGKYYPINTDSNV